MFIINYRKIFFGISVVLMTLSIFAMVSFGFNFGIDFVGGSIYEVNYLENRPEIDTLKTLVDKAQIQNYSVTPSGQSNYIIRMSEITPDQKTVLKNYLEDNGKYSLKEERFNSIGPVVGNELKNKAFAAISVVLVCIVLFITFAFRKVSKPVSSWKYGLATVIALAHDVIIPTGIFITWIHFNGGQIDVLFVSAILAILGYSVHDTIVVFDRVRENLTHNQGSKSNESFDQVVGKSLMQTMGRSINTSLTTFIVLVFLYFMGGESTKDFIFVLIIGIITGTYSSIFIASPILVTLQKLQKN
ncbi:MAG: protein translocase subunit SecF [Candidatus Paceibacterota bacterium]